MKALLVSARYDYQHWYRLVPDHESSQVIILSRDEMVTLLEKKDIELELVNKLATDLTYPLFVRLTSRSPKDSTLDYENHSDNYDFDCKASCSQDIITMIHNSKRCFEDLSDYIEADMDIGIVLQPFKNNIALRNELRLFVYEGELVAVSAVDEPNVKLTEDDLLLLKNYISSLDMLHEKFKEYVADVCIVDSVVTFIEINPYCPAIVDGFLFDWEDDRELLFPSSTPILPMYRYE